MTAPASPPVAEIERVIAALEVPNPYFEGTPRAGMVTGPHGQARRDAVAMLRALASPVSGDGSLQAEDRPSVPTCSPEFARLVLPSLYTAFDCIVSKAGGIAQERLEYVITQMERARDALPPPAASVSPGMETLQASECTKEGDQ